MVTPRLSKGKALRSLVGSAGEMARFIMTGGIATLLNMMVVWVSRDHLSVGFSIALGLATGMCASFLLMKLFAFRSNDWSGGWGEAVRFLCVYLVGTGGYFAAAMTMAGILSRAGLPPRWAAIGGVFAGGVVMAVTSYVGHRHFTYSRSTSDPAG